MAYKNYKYLKTQTSKLVETSRLYRQMNWIDSETEKTKIEVRRWPYWLRRDIPLEHYIKK